MALPSAIRQLHPNPALSPSLPVLGSLAVFLPYVVYVVEFARSADCSANRYEIAPGALSARRVIRPHWPHRNSRTGLRSNRVEQSVPAGIYLPAGIFLFLLPCIASNASSAGDCFFYP